MNYIHIISKVLYIPSVSFGRKYTFTKVVRNDQWCSA